MLALTKYVTDSTSWKLPLGISQNDKNAASKSFTDLSKDDSVYISIMSRCYPSRTPLQFRGPFRGPFGLDSTHSALVQVDPSSTVKTKIGETGFRHVYVSKMKIIEFKPDNMNGVCVHYMHMYPGGTINNVKVHAAFPTQYAHRIKVDDEVYSPIEEKEVEPPSSSFFGRKIWERLLGAQPSKPTSNDGGIHVVRRVYSK